MLAVLGEEIPGPDDTADATGMGLVHVGRWPHAGRLRQMYPPVLRRWAYMSYAVTSPQRELAQTGVSVWDGGNIWGDDEAAVKALAELEDVKIKSETLKCRASIGRQSKVQKASRDRTDTNTRMRWPLMEPRNTDINDVRPSALNHMVGQKSVVAQVAVALDAAFADGKKFDHALLVGSPGLGKTQTAQIIAQEMASGFHDVLGQSITSAADLNALLLGTKDKDVIHVDEAHELDKEYQTALYLALDQRKIVLQGGKSGRSPQSIPIADFTLLLSTTDEYALLQPLRDRMKLLLRFEFYSPDDLTEIVRHRNRALGWQVEDDVFRMIAYRSRGTPRLALRLLQACRRVCRSEGEETITHDHLQRACALEQTDDLGLGPTEQQYLIALAKGTSRLNVLASMLGLPARTVAQVSEPFLLRIGLILKDDQGRRQLTAMGREHVARLGSNED